MGIDMSNYKMIYQDQVFNVVSIMPTIDFNIDTTGVNKPKFIQASYVDENGELTFVSDEAWMFKFVRR